MENWVYKEKKGVLFWEIIRFIQNTYPKYLLLENVDRLLKSPSRQRGRDFAVMLSTLNELGYSVEWRVINAADYGNAQRRRRVFIFGYKKDLEYGRKMSKFSLENIIYDEGLFASGFPVEKVPNKERINNIKIDNDIVEISNNFSFSFFNSGVMRNGEILTIDTIPKYEKPTPLKDVIQDEVTDNYELNIDQINKFKYLRGPKKLKEHLRMVMNITFQKEECLKLIL